MRRTERLFQIIKSLRTRRGLTTRTALAQELAISLSRKSSSTRDGLTDPP